MSAPVRKKRVIRRVEVASTRRISPGVQRVELTGESLRTFAVPLPACHVKLVLPGPGESEPTLVDGPDGPALPDGERRPVLRTYTPRAWDPGSLTLTIDFVLHPAPGPASRWALAARPGDRLAVAGPGRGYERDPATTSLLLAGDETALPAIATLVATAPLGLRMTALVELPDPMDRQPLTGAVVTWLPRTNGEPAGGLVEAAVMESQVDGHVWVAGEAAMIRRLRRHLLGTGVPAGRLVTRGYWKAGEPNHTDGDHGQD